MPQPRFVQITRPSLEGVNHRHLRVQTEPGPGSSPQATRVRTRTGLSPLDGRGGFSQRPRMSGPWSAGTRSLVSKRTAPMTTAAAHLRSLDRQWTTRVRDITHNPVARELSRLAETLNSRVCAPLAF